MAEELLEEAVHVPSGCPLVNVKRATDVGDDLRHRARPVNGVPDFGPNRVEAQDLALLEIDQNRLLLDEAPGDFFTLGEPIVHREHDYFSRESFSKSVLERARIEPSVRHPHNRRPFR